VDRECGTASANRRWLQRVVMSESVHIK